MQTKKGFTLVELLIVIGILAILSTAAVLVINPAQLLAQSRDAKRAADIEALNAALAFYVADATALDLDGPTRANNCSNAGSAGAGYTTITPTNTTFDTIGAVGTSTTTSQVNTGSGWLPVNFTAVQSGAAPISSLPVDPTNTGNRVYRYACNGSSYELNVQFESTKYTSRHGADGGEEASYYEVGSALNL